MAPNLNPSDQALYPETNALFSQLMAEMPAEEKATPAGKRTLKVMSMTLVEPHIAFTAIETIQAPTLIIVGDTDLVRTEHAVAIFEHLPNGALAVLPNSTHAVPIDDPALFNATVERFLTHAVSEEEPHQRPDDVDPAGDGRIGARLYELGAPACPLNTLNAGRSVQRAEYACNDGRGSIDFICMPQPICAQKYTSTALKRSPSTNGPGVTARSSVFNIVLVVAVRERGRARRDRTIEHTIDQRGLEAARAEEHPAQDTCRAPDRRASAPGLPSETRPPDMSGSRRPR